MTGIGLVAVAVAAAVTSWHGSDALTCALLLGIGAVSVDASRRLREPAGASKNAHGLWELAIVILAPPFYAMIAPFVVLALTQWRVRRTLVHRRVFSAAAVGLANGAASLVFHAVWPHPGGLPASDIGLLAWGLLAAGCAMVRWVISNALVLTAIRLDDPAAGLRELLGGPAGLSGDAAELCAGVLVVCCAASSLVLLVFALPCGVLLQRWVRRAQLARASQTDPQTGLLSPTAWRREAAVQVTLAAAARAPLALALVRIDQRRTAVGAGRHRVHYQVHREVVNTLIRDMSRYDLPGRFGRDEFAVLLGRTGAPEALCIAELLRARISGLANPAGTGAAQITVSIGLATLDAAMRDVTDLLAAADAALYSARCSGSDSVRLAGYPPAA